MGRLFRRVLVPFDGSPHSGDALRVAADLASESDGRLIVVRAIAPFLPFEDLGSAEGSAWIPPEDIVETSLEQLEATVKKLLGRGAAPQVECRVIVGDAYTAIMEAAADADSIVMATHGRTGVEHLVIGSVTEKVVRHAEIPVLTIRAGSAKGPVRGRRN